MHIVFSPRVTASTPAARWPVSKHQYSATIPIMMMARTTLNGMFSIFPTCAQWQQMSLDSDKAGDCSIRRFCANTVVSVKLTIPKTGRSRRCPGISWRPSAKAYSPNGTVPLPNPDTGDGKDGACEWYGKSAAL